MDGRLRGHGSNRLGCDHSDTVYCTGGMPVAPAPARAPAAGPPSSFATTVTSSLHCTPLVLRCSVGLPHLPYRPLVFSFGTPIWSKPSTVASAISTLHTT